MKILVTGSNGLVGMAIREESVYFDHEFIYATSAVCDLTNYDTTLRLFQQHKPEGVLHLAANVGGLFKNMNDKVGMLEKNLIMNYNVVKCCYESGIMNAVCVLSTCIFPDKTSYPINESMLHAGPPHDSNDAYAYAKRMMEIHCNAYNSQYGTNYSCIIPTNIYGKHDNYSLRDGHVIPSLIHKCYTAKRDDIDFEVRGTGKPMRQFIYANNLAFIILKLVGVLNKESVIISDSVEYSIDSVARMIAKRFQYAHRLVYNDAFSDGQYKKTADNKKLRSILPSVSFIDMETGLDETISYFVDNYDKVRKG